jgi:hypothetical protein
MIEQSDPPPALTSLQRPAPLGSLLAAARRITTAKVKRTGASKPEGWQDDAWDMYDLVGEERFLAQTLANRMGAARLFAGRLPEDPTEPAEPVTEGPAYDAFEAFGSGSAAARAQIVARLGVNLFIAGDGWVVGIPRVLLAQSVEQEAPGATQTSQGLAPTGRVTPVSPDAPEGGLVLDDLEWRTCSMSEVTFDRDGSVTIRLGDGEGDAAEVVKTTPDEVFLIRVWRPHPRRWWLADSPTRSSLPVLREIVGLTMAVSAQIDSRLAGAGVYLVPESARRAVAQAAVSDGAEMDDGADPFTDALMEGMITPISDRSNASAVVPLVFAVPDDSIEKFKHQTFSTPFDAEARNLRDEAIRRLALGQDAPPELLLGMAGMNHWGAWLVREDVITTHVEPPLALICDAFTTQYLWPVLIEGGMSEEKAHGFVIWYDVDHLIMRPNRSQDALNLFDRGALSAVALRDASGFGDADAPPVQDPAVEAALALLKDAPSLAQAPGISALVEQIRAVMNGETAPEPEVEPTEQQPPGEPVEEQPADDVETSDDETGTPGTADSPPPADIAAGGWGPLVLGPLDHDGVLVSRP